MFRFPLIALLVLLSGCAATVIDRHDYTPPTASPVEGNELTLKEPAEQVWNRLVRNLSSSFFQINNIDKESRLINVSFAEGTDNDYLDCGISNREAGWGDDTDTYRYNLAKDSRFKRYSTWGPVNNLKVVADVNRRTSTIGRANIYVAPLTSNETQVTVNAQFHLKFDLRRTRTLYNGLGGVEGRNSNSDAFTVNVTSSKASDSFNEWDGDNNVICKSTGKFERDIIKLAQP